MTPKKYEVIEEDYATYGLPVGIVVEEVPESDWHDNIRAYMPVAKSPQKVVYNPSGEMQIINEFCLKEI